MAVGKRTPYKQSTTLEEVVTLCKFSKIYKLQYREAHPRAPRRLVSLNEDRAACRAMMATAKLSASLTRSHLRD